MIPNNPAEILLTLDQQLDHEVSLVLYGRAALCLGFDGGPPAFQNTQDVDAIISLSQLSELTNNDTFWDSLDRTNKVLSPKGLYITHLFCEDQVFLRPDWNSHRPNPHTDDAFPQIIPTSCHRSDPYQDDEGNDSHDMDDISFLVRRDNLSANELEAAFASVRMPDVPELHEAFDRALPVVRKILQAASEKSSE
jgi:hypothetical protein